MTEAVKVALPKVINDQCDLCVVGGRDLKIKKVVKFKKYHDLLLCKPCYLCAEAVER